MLQVLSAFFAELSKGEIFFLVECGIILILSVVLIQLLVMPKRTKVAEGAQEENTTNQKTMPRQPAYRLVAANTRGALKIHATAEPVPQPMPVVRPAPIAPSDLEAYKKVTEILTKKTMPAIEKSTLSEKLAEASPEVRHAYETIKAELTKYPRVKFVERGVYETYRVGRTKLAKVKISRKSVYLYLALNPMDERFNDGTMPHTDASDKKALCETPFRMKIQSPLSLRRAVKAIEIAADENGAL